MSALGTHGGNQYTQAETRQKTQAQVRDWQERVDVGSVLGILRAAAVDGLEVSASRIKAAEVLLDRLVPRLSAVEQTVIDELDTLTRGEILERIKSLLATDNSLLPELIGLQAREVSNAAVLPSVVAPPDKTGTR